MPDIPESSVIALDTVSLIYFLEQHEYYGETARIIFHRIESGDLQGLMSSLVFAELLVPIYRANDFDTARGLESTLNQFSQSRNRTTNNGYQHESSTAACQT